MPTTDALLSCEFLLPGLQEGGVVVEILLHGLIGSNGVIVGQVEQNSLKVQLLGTGSSQLVLHVLISHILQYLSLSHAVP